MLSKFGMNSPCCLACCDWLQDATLIVIVLVSLALFNCSLHLNLPLTTGGQWYLPQLFFMRRFQCWTMPNWKVCWPLFGTNSINVVLCVASECYSNFFFIVILRFSLWHSSFCVHARENLPLDCWDVVIVLQPLPSTSWLQSCVTGKVRCSWLEEFARSIILRSSMMLTNCSLHLLLRAIMTDNREASSVLVMFVSSARAC
jgi:hypothetical protein